MININNIRNLIKVDRSLPNRPDLVEDYLDYYEFLNNLFYKDRYIRQRFLASVSYAVRDM